MAESLEQKLIAMKKKLKTASIQNRSSIENDLCFQSMKMPCSSLLFVKV